MDPAEEQQVLAGAGMDREAVDIDTVVNGGRVVQIRAVRSASLIDTYAVLPS